MPDKEEILDALADMVAQHCHADPPRKLYPTGAPTELCALDSFALSANATAMRVLAKEGRLKIVAEYGRRVGANWRQK